MKLENIATELGNTILYDLKSEGWKIVSEYDPYVFNKGVDYDRYTLAKNNQTLIFEWDNWLEWEIKGPEKILKEIAIKFSLKEN